MINFYIYYFKVKLYIKQRKMGIWGLGIGPNPQSPIPNPQSPIPNPHNNIKKIINSKMNVI